MKKLEIVKLTDTAKIPTRGSKEAAGYDLYIDCDKETVIKAGETYLTKTGVAMAIPDGYFGAVYPRSGLATKRGLRLANCVGVIDSDYRGEIMVPLHNDTKEDQVLAPYERIAQIIFQEYLAVEFEEVSSLDDTERGEGGFGHSGRV